MQQAYKKTERNKKNNKLCMYIIYVATVCELLTSNGFNIINLGYQNILLQVQIELPVNNIDTALNRQLPSPVLSSAFNFPSCEGTSIGIVSVEQSSI